MSRLSHIPGIYVIIISMKRASLMSVYADTEVRYDKTRTFRDG